MTDTIIQHKHGTAADLAEVNPILTKAELCIETDTGKMKIGDGETEYNDLDYAGGSTDWGGIGGDILDQTDLTGYEGPATYSMNTLSSSSDFPHYQAEYLCSYGTTLWSTRNNDRRNTVYKSTNEGVSWTEVTLPFSTLSEGGGNFLTSANGILMAFPKATSYYPKHTICAISEDGLSWSLKQFPISTSWAGAVYNKANNTWLAYNCHHYYSTAISTDNGSTWTAYSSPWDVNYGSACVVDGYFVIYSESGGQGAYSEDGITWTTFSSPFGNYSPYQVKTIGDYAFAYTTYKTERTFLITNKGQTITAITYPDGANIKDRTSGVIYDEENNKYYICGGNTNTNNKQAHLLEIDVTSVAGFGDTTLVHTFQYETGSSVYGPGKANAATMLGNKIAFRVGLYNSNYYTSTCIASPAAHVNGYVDNTIAAHNGDSKAHAVLIQAHNNAANAHRGKFLQVTTDISSAISTHNSSDVAHEDIRDAIDAITPVTVEYDL